jgi:hypothetical protein
MSYPDWYGPNIALADALVLSKMYDKPNANICHENAEFLIQDGRLYILGTNDVTDLYEDIDVFNTSFFGGRVHSGFAEHASQVMHGLLHHGISSDEIKVVIGHSLGAAAAQCLGVIWGKPVVTFGAPKLWTKVGMTPLGYQHVRIYDRSDPVVAMPCRWFGWQHLDHARVPLGLPWYLGWIAGFRDKKVALVRYHLMSQYIAGLRPATQK